MTKGLRETKKEKVNKLLYDTALQLFREKGYEATSVREITQKAGVAKGTFFNHFPTKDHILATWYRQISDQATEYCANQTFTSAREAVITLMRENINRAFADADLIRAKARMSPSTELLSDEEIAQDDELKGFCMTWLRRDQEKDAIPETLDLEYFSNLVITIVTGNSRRWYYEGGFDVADSVEKDLNFLFDAITPEA